MNYNFLILSPFEFENLTRDLLQKMYKSNFESFGSGRDGGIDLRFSKSDNLIVQCKRYKEFSSLFQNLKKEVAKVQNLNPDKYLIVTSCSLLPEQKDKIIELFKPFIQNTGDIYGKEDLNNLLSQYPDIEKKYYKLWLSSTSILQEIVNSQIVNQSKFVKDEIFSSIGLYVQNESFGSALGILETNNYVIISGNPGIGKTTLAEMIVYHMLANGVEQFVYLSDSIKDGYELYIEGKSQIFLFDDFLGRNFLKNKLATNEESQIVRFIERIEKSANKYLVFTTREYILNQASETFEAFKLKDFSKYTIDIRKYSQLVKAEILYNHFHLNEIPFQFVQSLISSSKIHEIINHINYNPRIIESFTKSKLWESSTLDNFPKRVIELFDNPYLVWQHAFETQISECSKAILFNLLMTGIDAEFNVLYEQLRVYVGNNQVSINFVLNNFEFRKSLRELENSFIEITKIHQNVFIVNYKNPSVQDFLVEYLSKDFIARKLLVNSVLYLENALRVFDMLRGSVENNKKIAIGIKEIDLLKSYIESNFDRLENQSKFTVYSKPNDIDNHILKISNCFFHIENFDRKFAISKFQEVIESDRITWHSINEFGYLFEKFHDEMIFDPLTIIRNLVGCFTSFDELSFVYTFRDLYPIEYEDFKNNHEDEFNDLVYCVVDGISEEEIDDEEDGKEIIKTLGIIESDFDIDVYDANRIVEEKIEEIKKKNAIDEDEGNYLDEDFYRYQNYFEHHDLGVRRIPKGGGVEMNRSKVSPVKPVLSNEEQIVNLFETLE